jgi:hypothetical protein
MVHRHRLQQRSLALLSLLLLLSLGSSGCSKNAVAHPNQVNTFDGETYDTLIAIHAGIEQAKTELSNNTIPKAIVPGFKQALNGLVIAYNVANTSYQSYHKAAVAGTATPQMQADVQAKRDAAVAAQANLATVRSGK